MSVAPPVDPDAANPAGLPSDGAALGDTYSQVFKSSSVVGSAKAITLLIGLVRNKIAAVLLGTSGVGQSVLLLTILQSFSQYSGLGIGTSAVREIAEANASGDILRRSRAIQVLRRLCWLTGTIGCLAMIGFAGVLSRRSFGDESKTSAVALLGIAVLLGQISSGQTALIQGVRRIGDLARQQIVGAIASVVVTLAFYKAWGADGIAPALVAMSACTLAASWWFARRIPFEPAPLSWPDTFRQSRRFIVFGLAFMYAGAVFLTTSWAIQSLITQRYGESANGIYGAAWGMSAQFAAFILMAMSADYFPRLTAAASNHAALNRIVNQQVEIGVILALPGLVGTLAVAPWAVRLLYSREFLPAADLLPWFILGVFGRVVTWPLGYIQVALGQPKLFAALETVFGILNYSLAWLGAKYFGITGVAIAFALVYGIYFFVIRAVAGYSTGFQWSESALKTLLQSSLLVAAAFALFLALPPAWSAPLIGALTIFTALFFLRALASRLGSHHRLTRFASKIPCLMPHRRDASA